MIDNLKIFFSEFTRKTLASKFVRNVFFVASGSAAAQGITMLFAPIITRLYGPVEFGLLGMFVAIISVVTPVAALTYPVAIVLPASNSEAKGIAQLSLVVSLVFGVISAVFLIIYGDIVASMLGVEKISEYFVLIPLAMIFFSWMQIAQQWLIRNRDFVALGKVAVLQSGVVNLTKSLFGLFIPSGFVLIVISTFGYLVHAVLLIIPNIGRKETKSRSLADDNSLGLFALAIKYKDFAIYRAPQDLVNAASQSFPILFLASLFGAASAGFYVLAKMVMGVPSTLLGKAVGDVLYPRMAEVARNNEDLTSHILKSTAFLFLIGVVPFGVVMMLGPWIFRLAFGQEWSVAGVYSQWLAVFFLFNFINKPSVVAVPVLGIQRGFLIYEFVSTALKVFGLYAGLYLFSDDVAAVALFSLAGVVSYVFLIGWVVFESNTNKWRDFVR